MLVEDLPAFKNNQDVLSMDLDITVHDAAKEMAKRNIGSVVVTEGEMLCGIVTERDLLRKIVAENATPANIKLRDVMTADLEVVRPDDTIKLAIDLMTKGKFRHLPVIGSLGEVVSMLSQRDFMEI